MNVKKKIWVFSIIIITIIVNGCNGKPEKFSDKCINISKTDSLIQAIISVPDLYRYIPDEKKNYKYLVSPLLKPKSDYFKFGNDTLYLVNKNLVADGNVGTLFIDSVKFSQDSNLVDIVAKYYILGKYATTTTYLAIEFDPNLCTWDIKEQSTSVH